MPEVNVQAGPRSSVRRPLVGGNWKMNGRTDMARALAADVRRSIGDALQSAEVVVFPPFPYLVHVRDALQSDNDRLAGIALGGQDLSVEDDGAYTGDVSGAMLADVGCGWVLVGHSERRTLHGEDDAMIAAKVRKSFEQGLKPMICIGESLQTRQADKTEAFLAGQLRAVASALTDRKADDFAIAYEPIWAIGTGATATTEQAQRAHAFIRQTLAGSGVDAERVRILYGGSVKSSNATELFGQPDVDGGLIGGASLKASDFVAICQAAAATSVNQA